MIDKMEKLIKLLNEYETPKSGIVFKSYDDYDGTFYGVDCDGETEIAWSDSFVCGKRFQWIKWLVENDKIDRKKLEIRPFSDELVYSDRDCTVYRSDTTYEMLLMLLSIQDNPIDFLCGILK